MNNRTTALAKTAPASFDELLGRARAEMAFYERSPNFRNSEVVSEPAPAKLEQILGYWASGGFFLLSGPLLYNGSIAHAAGFLALAGVLFLYCKGLKGRLPSPATIAQSAPEVLLRLVPKDQEVLLKYLLQELKVERDSSIGPHTQLRKVQAERKATLEKAAKALQDLQQRIKMRQDPEQRQRLEMTLKRGMTKMCEDLKAKAELDKYIARVEAYFTVCEEKINAMAGPLSDMLLQQDVESYIDGVDDGIQASKDAIVSSYQRLCEGVDRLHSYVELLSGRMIEADALSANTSSREDLELMEANIKATLASLPGLPAPPPIPHDAL